MAVEIGSKGLEEVNLIIPQSTSLAFTIVHKDGSGNVVDHSASTADMAFQTKDKSRTFVMDSCVACSDDAIYVVIPATMSEAMPLGKMNWDIIVTDDAGVQTRLCYGLVTIIDTYAMDEE